MSIFRSTTLGCPACQTAVEFEAVHSVNADRRPDLRIAILEENFQQQACPKCGLTFRLDPEFIYLHLQRGQWIAASPLSRLIHWGDQEKHARDLFERSYGPDASELAQEIGAKLKPRVTFGWPALREKLLATEHFLDDITLELCKMIVLRTSDSPISSESELRLIDVVEGDLILAWLLCADESEGDSMRVGRALYDEIDADVDEEWQDLKATFSEALFVDLNRMMIPAAPD